jgi:hypothetical protein
MEEYDMFVEKVDECDFMFKCVASYHEMLTYLCSSVNKVQKCGDMLREELCIIKYRHFQRVTELFKSLHDDLDLYMKLNGLHKPKRFSSAEEHEVKMRLDLEESKAESSDSEGEAEAKAEADTQTQTLQTIQTPPPPPSLPMNMSLGNLPDVDTMLSTLPTLPPLPEWDVDFNELCQF